jgi:hypothetical protein
LLGGSAMVVTTPREVEPRLRLRVLVMVLVLLMPLPPRKGRCLPPKLRGEEAVEEAVVGANREAAAAAELVTARTRRAGVTPRHPATTAHACIVVLYYTLALSVRTFGFRREAFRLRDAKCVDVLVKRQGLPIKSDEASIVFFFNSPPCLGRHLISKSLSPPHTAHAPPGAAKRDSRHPTTPPRRRDHARDGGRRRRRQPGEVLRVLPHRLPEPSNEGEVVCGLHRQPRAALAATQRQGLGRHSTPGCQIGDIDHTGCHQLGHRKSEK